jgi:serine/threonine protein phosphatase 1
VNRSRRELVREAAGSEVLGQLDNVEHNVCIGNTIFVHGGLDPSVNPSKALAAPFTAFGGNHWAWIQEPFLAWRRGFGGAMVVHGHTRRQNTGLCQAIQIRMYFSTIV